MAQLHTNRRTLYTDAGDMDFYQACASYVLVQTPEDFEFNGISVSFTCTIKATLDGWEVEKPSIGWDDSGETPFQRGVILGDLMAAAYEAYVDYVDRTPKWLALCGVTGARNRVAQLEEFTKSDPLNIKAATALARAREDFATLTWALQAA